MPVHQTIGAEFSAAEVHQITGVSPDLQRVWRRRKYLPALKGGKHARFPAMELGYLLALKSFSDAGVSIEAIQDAASAAVLPIWDFIRWAHRVAGANETLSARSLADRHRYLVIRGERVSIGGDLSDLTKPAGAVLVTHIFDCYAAAKVILDRAPRPCIPVNVSR
jgi:hypothetical protein